jgi:hypothetical protein
MGGSGVRACPRSATAACVSGCTVCCGGVGCGAAGTCTVVIRGVGRIVASAWGMGGAGSSAGAGKRGCSTGRSSSGRAAARPGMSTVVDSTAAGCSSAGTTLGRNADRAAPACPCARLLGGGGASVADRIIGSVWGLVDGAGCGPGWTTDCALAWCNGVAASCRGAEPACGGAAAGAWTACNSESSRGAGSALAATVSSSASTQSASACVPSVSGQPGCVVAGGLGGAWTGWCAAGRDGCPSSMRTRLAGRAAVEVDWVSGGIA